MMNDQWPEAKNILDKMNEPNYDFEFGEKHLTKVQPNIMGFECHYVKYKTKKGIKSWLVLFNPMENCCYMNIFNKKEMEEESYI
jgi:hypothetical protein